MAKHADRAMLATACILLIVVLGTVQAGAPPGESYQLPGFFQFLRVNFGRGSSDMTSTTQTIINSSSSTTTVPVSSTVTSVTSRTSSHTETTYTYTTGPTKVAAASPLGILAWYSLAFVVVSLGVAMVILLLRRERPRVFDLKTMVEEMEEEKEKFRGSWSERLRNAALLRYYVLMAEVCSKVGIEDAPEETPQEFIGKASAELDVAGVDSEKFAEVVDRAHYGAELTEEEVNDASRFMDAFLSNVRRRVFNA